MIRFNKKEHRKAVEKNDPLSNIESHESETGHHMNINDTKILYQSSRLTQRLFLEWLATNTINRCKELSSIYMKIFGENFLNFLALK